VAGRVPARMPVPVTAGAFQREARSIVVRLPNWLGDTVMAVPALRSLREAFPAARLTAAGPWVSILAGQGLADATVTYPRSWAGRLRASCAVRALGADLAVVLPNSFESALSARHWRGRRRVGFGVRGRAPLLTDAVPLPSPRLHQVDEYLRLVEAIGVPAVTRVPRLERPAPDTEERVTIRDRLARVGVRRDGARIVGIHLGAAYGSAKLWPPGRVVELVARMRQGDRDVAVLLGPPESGVMAAGIVAATAVPSLVGLDSPELLPALCSEIDVLIGGDTGVSHLAAALDTPVVALFGPTDPALTAPRGPATVLRHAVPCAPCFYRTCPIDHPCMRGIDAEAVRAAAHAAQPRQRPEGPAR
jgi:lipopolysaccharide heptosyltransferase II